MQKGILLCLVFFFIMLSKAKALTDFSFFDTTAHLQPYDKVITKEAITKKGLFTISRLGSKVYIEIPDSLYNKDLLLVTRLTKGNQPSGPIGPLLPGDELTNMVIQFQKSRDNKLFLRKSLFPTYIGDSTAALYNAIKRSELLPIIAAFNIETINPSNGQAVVNISDLILGANEMFSFNDIQKGLFSIGAPEKETSYIDTILSFKNNLEITYVKSFKKNRTVRAITFSEDATFELNTSIVLLPTVMMDQRLEDRRVGYFSFREIDYKTNVQGINIRNYIKRWRLEPKKEDESRYLHGELVEPSKQIIYYIDPTTPKKWIPYLIQGVNDWNTALEQAGFKNAICALTAPTKEEDSSWSLYDARHSAIVYKPSEIENASGPNIADPRTGEILESHINWYHNVMQLIHNWYMVECAAVDPRARLMTFDDSLMGQLIRFVSSHEVGHTLGLTHNMGSSSTVPTDSLRNKKWVEENGICNSIMDYARFNYVAQPEDGISERGLFPRIGIYDKWAIEWGYKWISGKQSPDSIALVLARSTSERLKDIRLWYGPENDGWDPRIQTEDLGDNPLLASKYGIRNLQRIIPHLLEWTKTPDGNYENLKEMYDAIENQYQIYLTHVFKNLGGLYETIKNSDQPGPIYTPIPKSREQQIISFLNAWFFQTPYWLIDSVILSRVGYTSLGVIGGLHKEIFSTLFDQRLFNQKISREESNYPGQTYTLEQMFADLKKTAWNELYTHQPIDIYRRSLQNNYVAELILNTYAAVGLNTNFSIILPIAGSVSLSGSPVLSIVYGHLQELQKDIEKDIPLVSDKTTIYHLQFLLASIKSVLKESPIVFIRK